MSSDSSSSPGPGDSRTSPSYLKWSRSLTSLLDSPEGRDLFEEYLRGEGENLVEQLQFLWAVSGLKVLESTEDKIQKMIQIIYTTYLPILFGVSDSTRLALEENIKKEPNITIFDTVLAEVTEHMRGSLYPNFLKSDTYLNAVATYFEDGAGAGAAVTEAENPKSPGLAPCLPSQGSGAIVNLESEDPKTSTTSTYDLQTVREEEEMVSFNKQPSGPVRKLTRELLRSSQSARVATKKAGGGVAINPYHTTYSSYNPVSRQDSETQSLTSTEESLDLRPRSRHPAAHHHSTDRISSTQSYSSSSSRRQPTIPIQNRDSLQPIGRPTPGHMHTHDGPCPPPKVYEKPLAETDHAAFAKLLTEKLLKAREQRERNRISTSRNGGSFGANEIAQVVKKLQQQGIDEPEQDILDQHVSRVWSDKTPTTCSPNCEVSDTGRRRNRVPYPSTSWFKDNASIDSGMTSERDYRDRDRERSSRPHIHKPKPTHLAMGMVKKSHNQIEQSIDSGINTLSTFSGVSNLESGKSNCRSGNSGGVGISLERRGIPKQEPQIPGPSGAGGSSSSSSSRRSGPSLGAPAKRHSPPATTKEYLGLL